ncbi:hypothetical protein J4E86_004610 [Alternaria arbusti]|uniref:uncharacterized protein n=1 Tax=Alternaria arbusti TaxID=232088 RepID=UPI00222068D3|nr:uncharacterized protein J4E86_004610 [Alternaria arbusti]KAI4957472.1 hypothetical protein J4E86_004610 [Alternaria arbusti]
MNEEPKSFLGLACHVDKAFAQGEEPRVIIITPESEDGSKLEYPEHINAIRSVLKDSVFKDVGEYDDNHVIVVAYNREHGKDQHAKPPHEGGDPEKYSWLNGKFMLQFDPQHEPGRAALELWAEQSSQPVFSTQWASHQTHSGAQLRILNPTKLEPLSRRPNGVAKVYVCIAATIAYHTVSNA